LSAGLGTQDRQPGEVLAAREVRTSTTLCGVESAVWVDDCLEPRQERSARVGGRLSRVVAGMLRVRADATEGRKLF